MPVANTFTEESALILRSEILVIPNDNYRTDLKKVEEMAALLEKSGQLQEVRVTRLDPPAPTGEKYRLTFGFRRMAGWDLLKWRDSRPVKACIKTYPVGDPTKAILDNYHANHHEPVHPYDEARLITMLERGAEEGDNGFGEIVLARAPLTADEARRELCMTESRFRKLRKLAMGTDPAVKKMARDEGAPFRVLYAIACLKGEGDTEEEVAVNRRERQEAKLNQWVASRDKLKAENRQRAKPVTNGHAVEDDSDDSDDGPSVRDNGRGDSPKPVLSPKRELDGKARSVEIYMASLSHKRDAMRPKNVEEKEAKARVEGALAVLEFLTSPGKQFPKDLLKEADFDALQKTADAVAAEKAKSNGAGARA